MMQKTKEVDMRRILIAMAIGFIVAALCAADTMNIQPVKVLPGKRIALTVTAQFDGPVTAAEFQVKFDPKVLQFDRIEKSDLSKDAMHAVHDSRGILRAAFASATPFPGDGGVLCTLWFTVVGSPDHAAGFDLGRILINDRKAADHSIRVDLAKPLNRLR